MARKRLVTGIEHVRRVFRRAPEEMQVRIIDALNQGAEEIADRARMLAPVDPSTPIDLKDTIDVVVATRTNARGGREVSEPNSVAAYVVAGGTPERRQAALRMEFGRAPGGSGPRNASHPGHPAQPFMYPAYFSIRNRVRSRIKRAVRAAARAAAGRG